MLAGLEQRQDDPARGIVGVGDQIGGHGDFQGGEQFNQFIQQGALVAIAEDHAFMNAAGQWQGEEAGGGLDDDGDGLAGMSEDVFGLGVVLRFLMKLFDTRHLFPGLGCFDAVGQQDDAVIDGEEVRAQGFENESHPAPGKTGQINTPAMKEVEEPVIAGLPQTQGANQTGNAAQVTAGAGGG